VLRRGRPDPAVASNPSTVANVPQASEDDLPAAPPGARNLVVVTLDSCRYDSWVAAEPENLGRLGPVQQRWSYASWTAPSHYNLLMGLLPHTSPPKVYASEYYKQDFLRYSDRLGVDGIEWKRLLPSLHFPTFLRHGLGYRTHALVSLPVLNPMTAINRDFDRFELMPQHNDMAAMVDRLQFDDRPAFYLLNVGETHYPYALPHEPAEDWPHVSGLHGVVKHLDDATDGLPAEFFTSDELRRLQERQVEAVRYLDGVFGVLFDRLPDDTWVIVTADHGELFGEQGFFGHGPVNHDKVLEVPFVEGPVPR
jgi:hypothetical protein